MTAESSSSRVDLLLAQGAWVRRLARGLLQDPDAAEDLSQETLVAGWRHQPSVDRPVRGWLARVARNLARNRAIQDGARKAREAANAALADDAIPSPEE